MTRQEAWKRLQKLYGKKAAFRVMDGAPNASDREKAAEAAKEIAALKRELDERIEARKRVLLNVPDYKELLAARETAKKKLNELTGVRFAYKFTAGYVSSLGFFHVEAHGDTWEEVFAEIKAKNPNGVVTI